MIKGNLSNFFEKGKKHYSQVINQNQNALDQSTKNKHRRICLNLYNYDQNSKYSQSSMKINTRENSVSSISSDSKTPFSSNFVQKTHFSQYSLNFQSKSERLLYQNPEMVDKAAVPMTNCQRMLQNYQKSSPEKSKFHKFSKQSTDLKRASGKLKFWTYADPIAYANIQPNRTTDYKRMSKLKRTINLWMYRDSQNLQSPGDSELNPASYSSIEVPETIQSARKLLKLAKNVNSSSIESIDAEWDFS